MTVDITLYIGGGASSYVKYHFTEGDAWAAVKEQILAAMERGRGVIEIERKGERIAYVYNAMLAVSWVEKSL